MYVLRTLRGWRFIFIWPQLSFSLEMITQKPITGGLFNRSIELAPSALLTIFPSELADLVLLVLLRAAAAELLCVNGGTESGPISNVIKRRAESDGAQLA